MLVSWVATSITIFSMVYLYSKLRIYWVSEKVDLGYAVVHMVGCLTEPEPKTFLPKKSGGREKDFTTNRIAFFFPTAYSLLSLWYLCSMVLNWAYTSNLRAYILRPVPGTTIDSDQDVVDFASAAYMPFYPQNIPGYENKTL